MAGGTSNHIHFIVGVTDAYWKARWKSHLFTNPSKEIGALYDWPGPMFERRGRSSSPPRPGASYESWSSTICRSTRTG